MARLLIVDDASFMRMTIRQMLEPHGHEVVGEAGDGIEAVKKFIEVKPDIVVLTGHDSVIKEPKDYLDLNNYRNSKYFLKSVEKGNGERGI